MERNRIKSHRLSFKDNNGHLGQRVQEAVTGYQTERLFSKNYVDDVLFVTSMLDIGSRSDRSGRKILCHYRDVIEDINL